MIIQHLNWIAVLVSGLAYFCIGAIWFNPKVFGTMWMKGHNLSNPTEEDKKSMPKLMMLTLLLSIISAIGTGYFVYALNSMDWMMGAKIGLVISASSAFVAIGMTHLYTKKSMTTIIVDSLYHIVGAIVCGIILSVWR